MKRPAAILVFGILNLVFAAFGLFGLLSTAAMLSLPKVAPGNPVMTMMRDNPVLKMVHDNPTYAAWIKLSLPLGSLTCLLLLAGGIGLLQNRAWGRKASIGYAICAILFGLTGTAINAMVLIPPALRASSQSPEQMVATTVALSGTIGGCIGLIYPILLLIFMTRPSIVAALDPTPPPLA